MSAAPADKLPNVTMNPLNKSRPAIHGSLVVVRSCLTPSAPEAINYGRDRPRQYAHQRVGDDEPHQRRNCFD
jgi:hypothetical protein